MFRLTTAIARASGDIHKNAGVVSPFVTSNSSGPPAARTNAGRKDNTKETWLKSDFCHRQTVP
jgi:hypothetical protein